MDAMIALLSTPLLGKAAWLWLSFFGIVLLLLAFDLGVLNKKDHEIGIGESLKLSAFYIAIAAIFGGWVWWYLGPTPGMQYFTGFALEKALAMDNVFVISLIFTYFAVPRLYQHRVLFSVQQAIIDHIRSKGVVEPSTDGTFRLAPVKAPVTVLYDTNPKATALADALPRVTYYGPGEEGYALFRIDLSDTAQ